jgi:hypothetical protein
MIAALAAAALLAGWTQVGTGPDGGTSRSGSTLRHLQLFGGLGAWDGYFTPLRDGPLAHATRAQLAAHDPAALVREEDPNQRQHRLRARARTAPPAA